MPGEHLAASGCRCTWLETTPGLWTGQGCRGLSRGRAARAAASLSVLPTRKNAG